MASMTAECGSGSFAVGATVVRRDLTRGRVWSASAHRVLRDDGRAIVVARWPGAEALAAQAWLRWLRTRGEDAAARALSDRAAGSWELGQLEWRGTRHVLPCREPVAGQDHR
jgi:hypothetical protein